MIYLLYLGLVLVLAYFIIRGKGNKTFSIAYRASMLAGSITGLIYLYNCYNGNYNPTPAYHSIVTFLLFALLNWIKNSFKIIIFDRRFR